MNSEIAPVLISVVICFVSVLVGVAVGVMSLEMAAAWMVFVAMVIAFVVFAGSLT